MKLQSLFSVKNNVCVCECVCVCVCVCACVRATKWLKFKFELRDGNMGFLTPSPISIESLHYQSYLEQGVTLGHK